MLLFDSNAVIVGCGGIVGLILAICGAGGGSIAIPLLVLGFGITMQQAAPVGLIAVSLAAATGAGLGLLSGTVRYRAALLMGALGALCAPVGIWLAHQIPNQPLMLSFSLVMAWTGIQMLRGKQETSDEGSNDSISAHPCRIDALTTRIQWTRPCALALAATGALSGLLSGLFGVGGGFVIVPALSRFSNLSREHITPTSMAVIVLLSLSGISGAVISERIVWPLALPFTGGCLAGLFAGRLIASTMPQILFRRSFGLVSLLISALMFCRALGFLSFE